MMTLDGIGRKLRDIRDRKAAQQRIVEDLERPLKLLRQIEAEEAAAAAEEARVQERVAHLQSQLTTHEQWIADWAPFEAQMPGTITMLEAIEDGKVMSRAVGFTQWNVNVLKSGLMLTLEGLAEGRQKVAELKAELKKLGVKV